MTVTSRLLSQALQASLVATGVLLGGAASVAVAQGMGNMPGMSDAPDRENTLAAEELPGVATSEGAQQGGAPAGTAGAGPVTGMPMPGAPATGMPMTGMGGMSTGGSQMGGMPMMGMSMMGMPMMGMGGAGANQPAAGAEATDQKIEVLNRKIDALVETIERMRTSGSQQGDVPEPEVTN